MSSLTPVSAVVWDMLQSQKKALQRKVSRREKALKEAKDALDSLTVELQGIKPPQ